MVSKVVLRFTATLTQSSQQSAVSDRQSALESKGAQVFVQCLTAKNRPPFPRYHTGKGRDGQGELFSAPGSVPERLVSRRPALWIGWTQPDTAVYLRGFNAWFIESTSPANHASISVILEYCQPLACRMLHGQARGGTMLLRMAETKWRAGLILVSLLVPGGSLLVLSALLSKRMWTGGPSPLVARLVGE